MEEIREFKAYTYYLFHVPTSKKYYGVRWANTCAPHDDLWKKYFSSSEIVTDLVDQYGKDSFVVEVRKEFTTSIDAVIYENRVLHKLKAVEKEDWLNQSYAFGPHYVLVWTDARREQFRQMAIGENNPNYGNYWTEEQKQIARDRVSGEKNPMYGKKKPEAELQAMSERVKGNKNPMYEKTGDLNPMYGKTGELSSCFGRTGDKHPMYGKHLPEYHLQILRKPVKTPLGTFNSVRAAAKAHNITDAAMSYRCKRKIKGCEYLPKPQ
jgi:hypothetical protein